VSGVLWATVVAALLGAVAGRVIDSLAVVAPRRPSGASGGVGIRTGLRDRALGAPWPELAGALAAAAVTARFGWSPQLPAWLWFVAVGLLLAVVDLRTSLLPDRVVLPGVVGGLALLAVAAGLDGSADDLLRGVSAAAVAFGALLLLALINPRGMGMGDVKLAGVLGLFLGLLDVGHVLLGLFLGFLLGSVGGITLLATGIKRRGEHIPFAPFLAAGALVSLLVGAPILDWYAT
jgi:leader peptidase (prepilin peptidase)/N-methyltransferase